MRPAPEATPDADATTTGISATFVEYLRRIRQFRPTTKVDGALRSCESAQPIALPMLLTGSILDRVPGRTYTGALRFAELSLRSPLPRAATLADWRKGLPEGFKLALRAPRQSLVSATGPLRFDAALEAGLQWLLDAAKALEVSAIVLPTPADLTPGARSRELLGAYVAKIPREAGRHIVWSPSGVWEPEEAEPLCDALGLIKAFDPLETRRPGGDVVYATLRALGHRSSFSTAALEDALEAIEDEPVTEAFLSVDAERSFEIAKRLQRMAADRGLAEASPSDDQDDQEDDDDVDDPDDADEESGDDTP
jgi:uncharacterized protein YecE (DUF72 family)